MNKIKSWVFSKFAQNIVQKEEKYARNAQKYQRKWLSQVLFQLKNTQYARSLKLGHIADYEAYRALVPLVQYEEIEPFVQKIKKGEQSVLSNTSPLYLLKTSGTTSGTKFIPIGKKNLMHQIKAAQKVLCYYAVQKGKTDFVDYKMIFIQGSPTTDKTFAIPAARLSGVVYHFIPRYLQKNKLPSYETNCIEPWTAKIEAIVDETLDKNISVIGGIPPWCIQYFEKLLAKSGAQNMKQLYPNLSLYIAGGVDFSPYEARTKTLLGGVDCRNTFPASEGFFAIGTDDNMGEMRLLVNQGIFYEFIPFEEVQKKNPETLSLEKVALNQVYELVISNVSGLYRYRMGDLVRFTSLKPYKIVVSGRTKHYISAFGEHVIGEEVDDAMRAAVAHFGWEMVDFFVYPDVAEKRYVWLVELKENPDDFQGNIEEVSAFLDQKLAEKNPYYKHLIEGKIIEPCQFVLLKQGAFNAQRQAENKLGEQYKTVHLSSDGDFGRALIRGIS